MDGGHVPKAAELEAIAELWRPYRSLPSLYLWSSLDNAPD
jgi:3-methyladenine DNA glycosylase/8-oxoguanine DNA glycosylase